jgi:hypothetical protein
LPKTLAKFLCDGPGPSPHGGQLLENPEHCRSCCTAEEWSIPALETTANQTTGFFGARFLELNGLEKTVSQVSDEPEVLPGWNLRLNVHEDGRGYDVLLVDKTDKACSYAALTDESGVIRQSKAIDCEI